MDRVSFSPRARSVQRPRSPCQGHRHVPGTHPTPPLPLFNTESSMHQVDSSASGVRRRLLKETLETAPWGSKALSIWKERAASHVPDVSLSTARACLRPSELPDSHSVPLPPVVPVIIGPSERGHPRTGPTCSCRVLATPASPVRKLGGVYRLWAQGARGCLGTQVPATLGSASSDPVLGRDSIAPDLGEER